MAAPRPVAVVGMWLIFGPQVPVLLLGLFITISNLVAPGQTYQYGSGGWMRPVSDGVLMEFFKLIVLIALLALYGAILWKVTARCVRARRPAGGGRGFPVIPVADDGNRGQ